MKSIVRYVSFSELQRWLKNTASLGDANRYFGQTQNLNSTTAVLPPNIESLNPLEADNQGYMLGLKTTIWKTVLCKHTMHCWLHKSQDTRCFPRPHRHFWQVWSKQALNKLSVQCVRDSFQKKERSNQTSSLLLHAASKHRNFSCPQLLGQSCQREGCNSNAIAHCMWVITNTNRTFSGLETGLWLKSPACARSPNCGDSGSKAFVIGAFGLQWSESGQFCMLAPPHGTATDQNKRGKTQKKKQERMGNKRETNRANTKGDREDNHRKERNENAKVRSTHTHKVKNEAKSSKGRRRGRESEVRGVRKTEDERGRASKNDEGRARARKSMQERGRQERARARKSEQRLWASPEFCSSLKQLRIAHADSSSEFVRAFSQV